eukprot:41040_1
MGDYNVDINHMPRQIRSGMYTAHPVMSAEGLVKVPGSSWLDMNCYKYVGGQPRPFLYGVMCSSSMHNTGEMVIAASVLVMFILLSVLLKRKSARPGGRIYQYNQSRVHMFYSNKRRRLRDMLNDPILVKDMEKRYGDLSSLRESVKQWESDGFAIQKKEDDGCTNGSGGRVTVPWVETANVWLALTFSITMYFNFNVLTMTILLTTVVHWVDNMLLRKAAVARVGRGESKNSENKGLIADTGVPVPEADVGVPVNKSEIA